MSIENQKKNIIKYKKTVKYMLEQYFDSLISDNILIVYL